MRYEEEPLEPEIETTFLIRFDGGRGLLALEKLSPRLKRRRNSMILTRFNSHGNSLNDEIIRPILSRVMNELTHSLHFPLSEQKEEEVRVKVQDVVNVLEGFKDGLDPLERQVREVFHGIVRGRIWKG
ncbi:hypothetical protein P8452_76065 [Trifolium repens]|nr:hypothetical protein P8452_76065 [Trifolium repens]